MMLAIWYRFVVFLKRAFINRELDLIRSAFKSYRIQAKRNEQNLIDTIQELKAAHEREVGHLRFLLENSNSNQQATLDAIHHYLGLIRDKQESGPATPVHTTVPSWSSVRDRLESREREKANNRWRQYAEKNESKILNDADAVLVSD